MFLRDKVPMYAIKPYSLAERLGYSSFNIALKQSDVPRYRRYRDYTPDRHGQENGNRL